jgi:hypothetical protein
LFLLASHENDQQNADDNILINGQDGLPLPFDPFPALSNEVISDLGGVSIVGQDGLLQPFDHVVSLDGLLQPFDHVVGLDGLLQPFDHVVGLDGLLQPFDHVVGLDGLLQPFDHVVGLDGLLQPCDFANLSIDILAQTSNSADLSDDEKKFILDFIYGDGN